MGTRADFYEGRGKGAKWLGSIAWDGYPDGIDKPVLEATSIDVFKAALLEFFNDRDDVTLPGMGWPWPWDTSSTTDYAYAFDDGAVWISCFGGKWFEPDSDCPEDDEEGSTEFPDMSDRRDMATDNRSGCIFVGA